MRLPPLFALIVLATTALFSALPAQAQNVQPMRFALIDDDVDCAACRYIRAVGDIEHFTAAQFRDFVKAYGLEDQSITVVLSSPGGDVIAGVRLGREIRARGFNTQVGFPARLPHGGHAMRPGDCASACSYAFLGGVHRFAADEVLGIHRFFPGNLEPDNQVIVRPGDEAVTAMIKVFAIDMGVDADFIEQSMDVPPSDMRYMRMDELQALGVITQEEPIALVAESGK